MFQQMHAQFVNGRETFRAMLALVFSLGVISPYMLANNRILDERSLAVGTAEYTILIPVCLNVIFQHYALTKYLFAHRTLKRLLVSCKVKLNINIGE